MSIRYPPAAAVAWVAIAHLGLSGQSITSQPSPSGRVSGWTVSADQPLAAVEVGLACPPLPVRRTVSDAHGHFDLAGLPTGNCNIRATKPGYVDAISEGPGGRTSRGYGLRVVDGESQDGFRLELPRGVTLTGTVTDSDGRPVLDVTAHAVRRDESGRWASVPIGRVNVDGRFENRTMPAGDYVLAAVPFPVKNDGSVTRSRGYSVTYFPGTPTFAQATTLSLKPGEARDVHLSIARSPVFRVSGIAFDGNLRPLGQAALGLSLDGVPHWIRGGGTTGRDGTFTFPGIAPGVYRLSVSAPAASEYGEARFEVTSADVEGIMVRTRPR